MPQNNLNSRVMKHLSYEEFTNLMEKRGETTVITDECTYEFTGISKYTVCIQVSFRLKEKFQIGETGFFIKFDKVITLTEAQCMYMSLK